MDDQLGDRVLDFEAPLDGKEHKQTVIGTPASVTAARKGDELFLEIKRQAHPGVFLDLSQTAWRGRGLDRETSDQAAMPRIRWMNWT
jgi:hypothetical protein